MKKLLALSCLVSSFSSFAVETPDYLDLGFMKEVLDDHVSEIDAGFRDIEYTNGETDSVGYISIDGHFYKGGRGLPRMVPVRLELDSNGNKKIKIAIMNPKSIESPFSSGKLVEGDVKVAEYTYNDTESTYNKESISLVKINKKSSLWKSSSDNSWVGVIYGGDAFTKDFYENKLTGEETDDKDYIRLHAGLGFGTTQFGLDIEGEVVYHTDFDGNSPYESSYVESKFGVHGVYETGDGIYNSNVSEIQAEVNF